MPTKKNSSKTLLANVLVSLLHKKSFQKISVNELCESANISRTAFYSNFEDKYQLLAYCINIKTEELNVLMEQHSPQEFLSIMLDYIQKEDRFFYNAFGSDLVDERGEILYQFFNQQITKILKEKSAQGIPLSGPIDVISSFYIGGLTSMVLRWIMSNYKLPKSELAACQYRLLKELF